MSVLIWIPIVLAFYVFYGWLSLRDGWFALWMAGLFPAWVIISRNSNNLVFDGALYDVTMTAGFLLGMAIYTDAEISGLNYAGIALIIVGLCFIKL